WFLLGVCVLFIATAGLISLGRITFGAEIGVQPFGAMGALDVRYYSFAAPLWAAVLLLGFILLKRNLEGVSRNAWVILDAGALLVSVVVCAGAYFIGPNSGWLMLYLHELPERAATAIVARAPDQAALDAVYPYPGIDILSSVSYLASNRLSI